MALPVQPGAKVLIDLKETIEQSQFATFTYINSNTTVIVDSGKTRIFSLMWEPDAAGTITLHDAGSASNPFLVANMTAGGNHQFGPNGLLLDGGLTIVVAGATTPNVTVLHSS